MDKETMREFHTWHNDFVDSGQEYNLKTELLDYCRQDCLILWQGSAKLRQKAVDTLTMDPFFCCTASPQIRHDGLHVAVHARGRHPVGPGHRPLFLGERETVPNGHSVSQLGFAQE
jgi:hypothetical protein